MCEIDREQLDERQLQAVETFERSHHCEIVHLAEDDGQIYPTLINGQVVDRAEWLEVVRVGRQSCSATMVGPRVAVTAAHCQRNGSVSDVEIYNGPRVRARAVNHPRYRSQGAQYDVAVLILDETVDIPFARVGLDYNWLEGADVDLLGYGCTRPGGGGGNDGRLRYGESKVVAFSGTDVITRHRPNGGALCFGDSGGPMFADGSDTPEQNVLIAVNSKGNIRDTNYNMMLQGAAVESFFAQVIDQYQVKIYGINAGDDDDDPGPQPDPQPGRLAAAMAEYQAELSQLHATWQETFKGIKGSAGCGDCIDEQPEPDRSGLFLW